MNEVNKTTTNIQIYKPINQRTDTFAQFLRPDITNDLFTQIDLGKFYFQKL